ncbi:sensor histidine kinase [Amnibacterium endophyticum]|uniref:Sensor histidine kinase n=1 Tax=Amnibacterium endophyticum TaxID=2109337 RepID=A0ABW4L9L6_9MICO
MSGRGGAEERVRRVASVLFAVGALVFGLIILGAILSQLDAAPAWWTAASLLAILGTALALGAAAPFAPLPVVRGLAAATAIGYALVAASMPFAVEPDATQGAAPWPLGLTAIGTTAAALAFRPAIAWASTVLLGVSVAVDRIATADRDLTAIALQDAAYAAFFAAVYVALVLGSLAAARRVDEAAATADATAAASAVERVQQEERDRVDALVHDRVLATLLLAARRAPGTEGAVQQQAIAARAGLTALLDGTVPDGPIDAAVLADRLRNQLTQLAPWADLEAAPAEDTAAIPAEVAEALVGATGEALRNAVRHAGADASIAVRVEATAEGVAVTVLDNGVGFEPRATPLGRLGIASSIERRMSAAGGEAVVRSMPGRGTAVRLLWTRP